MSDEKIRNVSSECAWTGIEADFLIFKDRVFYDLIATPLRPQITDTGVAVRKGREAPFDFFAIEALVRETLERREKGEILVETY